jgi:hypothetical protein
MKFFHCFLYFNLFMGPNLVRCTNQDKVKILLDSVLTRINFHFKSNLDHSFEFSRKKPHVLIEPHLWWCPNMGLNLMLSLPASFLLQIFFIVCVAFVKVVSSKVHSFVGMSSLSHFVVSPHRNLWLLCTYE